MGDRPSSAIAQTALQKTALEAMNTYPEISKTVLRNSYMDYIPGSVESHRKAFHIMKQIEIILEQKGFKIKEWLWSHMESLGGKDRTTNNQKAVQMLLHREQIDAATEKVFALECTGIFPKID